MMDEWGLDSVVLTAFEVGYITQRVKEFSLAGGPARYLEQAAIGKRQSRIHHFGLDWCLLYRRERASAQQQVSR